MLSDHFYMGKLLDLFAFYFLSLPLVFVLTYKPLSFWFCFPIGIFKVYEAMKNNKPMPSSSLDMFKMVKIVSSFGALLLVNFSQLGKQFSVQTIGVVLAVNMVEASFTDLMINPINGLPNCVSGLILVFKLLENTIGHHESFSSNAGVFQYPLKTCWILGYTMWNAAFVYGVGFAWSFVMILITPLFLSASNPTLWLGARTYSLVLNQALRASKACWLFTPGESFVTKPEGSESTDETYRLLIGLVNCLGMIILASSTDLL